MKAPRYWKVLERHPLSAEYDDIKGAAWQRFVEGVERHGVILHRKVILHDGKVIDGWQLYRASVELDTKPQFAEMPKGMTPEEFVEIVQDNRRHETQEAAVARAAERRQRVADARAREESLREIAKQEGVGVATVRRDLEAENGPSNSEISAENGGTSAPPARSTTEIMQENGGSPEIDGKTPTATGPVLCSQCQRRKRTGQPELKRCPDCKTVREALAGSPPSTSPPAKTKATPATLPEKCPTCLRPFGKRKAAAEPLPEIPESLNTPAFREAWAEWLQHRKEKKQPMTATSAKKQFAEAVEWGPERAVKAINHSIKKGWQGLFEEGSKAKPAEQHRGLKAFLAGRGK